MCADRSSVPVAAYELERFARGVDWSSVPVCDGGGVALRDGIWGTSGAFWPSKLKTKSPSPETLLMPSVRRPGLRSPSACSVEDCAAPPDAASGDSPGGTKGKRPRNESATLCEDVAVTGRRLLPATGGWLAVRCGWWSPVCSIVAVDELNGRPVEGIRVACPGAGGTMGKEPRSESLPVDLNDEIDWKRGRSYSDGMLGTGGWSLGDRK